MKKVEEKLDKKVKKEEVSVKKEKKKDKKVIYGRKDTYSGGGQSESSFYSNERGSGVGYDYKSNISENFSGSGYEEAVVQMVALEHDELGEKEVLTHSDMMDYLRRFAFNNFFNSEMNPISVEEKEKFNNYAMFNKTEIMMNYSRLGFGEKPLHAPEAMAKYDMKATAE